MESLLALHLSAISSRAERARALEAKYRPDAATGAHEAFIAAFDAEECAQAALVAALAKAEWGAQPDGSFVTRSSAVASTRYTRTLHAPGRGGPLAAVEDWERGQGASLVALRTHDEARAIRDAEKRRAREAATQYTALCAEVDAAVAAGAWLWYVPGQEHGTLALRRAECDEWGLALGATPPKVSARGVCRRAHVLLTELPDRAAWVRFGQRAVLAHCDAERVAHEVAS